MLAAPVLATIATAHVDVVRQQGKSCSLAKVNAGVGASDLAALHAHWEICTN